MCAIIVKWLSDAICDHDPIRAVVLDILSDRNGRTAGIASPKADAQALAIRAVYVSAATTDCSQATYLECLERARQPAKLTSFAVLLLSFLQSPALTKHFLLALQRATLGTRSRQPEYLDC